MTKRLDGLLRTRWVQARLLLTYAFGPQLTSDQLLEHVNKHRAMLGKDPLEKPE